MALAHAAAPSSRLVVASPPPPRRPILKAVSWTGRAVGGLFAAVGGSSVGAVAYEAHLSREECDVSVPLRPRSRASTGGEREDAAERSCVVVGGGVVGVTTAYFLARRGFQVTLLERRRAVAEEASAVNAGWLRVSPAPPLSPLQTVQDIVVDKLAGLGAWTAFRLWASGLDLGFLRLLREYCGELRGDGEPPPGEGGGAASPAAAAAAGPLRDAAVQAASHDASFFVSPGSLLAVPGGLRFALRFAAAALAEAAGAAREAPVEECSLRETSQALSTRSVDLIREIVREERLSCPPEFRGQLCVTLGSAGRKPRYMQVDEGTEVWEPGRILREFSFLQGSQAERQVSQVLWRPEDGIGDCATFTRELADVCRERYGVKFRFGADVRELQLDDQEASGKLIARVQCADGRRFYGSFFVLANGAAAGGLAREIADKHCARPRPVYLPLCGIRGYSLTLLGASIPKEHLEALRRLPCVAFEPSKLVLSAYPSASSRKAASVAALRFSAIAELSAEGRGGGGDDERCAQALRRKALAVSPPALHEAIAAAEVVSGLRPQSPDDLPIVSGTRCPNLFVNVGHGGYGWRLACASAELLSELVDTTQGSASGSPPEAAASAAATAAAAPPPLPRPPDSPAGLARRLSLRRFAGGVVPWRAAPGAEEDFPELSGHRVGPLELLWSTRPPGFGE